MCRVAVLVMSVVWLMTHMGCMHPLGNMLALVLAMWSATSLLLPYAVDWASRNLDLPAE